MARKLKAAAIECRELLEKALYIAKTEGNIGWVLSWATSRDELEGYGYTVELHEEIDSLKERMEAYPAELPKIENAMDEKKYEFFMANFSKIPLDALEYVVETVAKNKLHV